MKTALWFVIIIAATVLSAACQHRPVRPTIVSSHEEAAAATVSVTNVVPWEEIASSMQPNFNLTGDQALLQVLPATERIQEQVLSAFGASLGIGLPQSFSQSTASRSLQISTNTTIPDSGPSITTGTRTSGDTSNTSTTIQPGAAPDVPTGVPAGGLLPSAASVSGEIGLDPLLKYQSALSLFESVQMMNREIQNATVLTCHTPFLIRMRLTVIPYRSNLPYEIHSRISFFPHYGYPSDDAASGAPPVLKERVTPSGMEPIPPAIRACIDKDQLPQIVPILAADNIERALKSRATEAAQQIGFALGGMLHGIAGNLGLNNLNQTLQSISGQDFNNRLTVTRQSDNTLYVRIGTTNQASAGAALAGQNYDIALLLLAPNSYFHQPGSDESSDPRIQIFTHTQFRNTLDGSILKDRSAEKLVYDADKIMDQILLGPRNVDYLKSWNRLNNKEKEEFVRDLAAPIQQSNYAKFLKVLKETYPSQLNTSAAFKSKSNSKKVEFTLAELTEKPDIIRSLWAAASTLLADSTVKGAFFQLSAPTDIKFAPNQTALLIDDMKSNSVVQIATIKGTSAATLLANLNIATKGSNQKYSLPAQTVRMDPRNHLATIVFPSSAQWGIDKNDLDFTSINLNISQVECGPMVCPKLKGPKDFQVLVARPSTGDVSPSLMLSQNSAVIVRNKDAGTGSAMVTISKMVENSATITLKGADIVSAADANGTPIKHTNGSIDITENTTICFNLMNLYAGGIVTVTADGKKDGNSTGKKTIQFIAVD